jgi:putative MATE family efflux protein
MWRLALPALAEESLLLLVSWTDWWLAGHYLAGDDTKAAMGLMSYLTWLIPSFFALISIGALALVARAVGSRDFAFANRVANQSILLGVILAIAITLGLYVGKSSLIHAMQLQGEAHRLAVQYLGILLFAVPLIMFEQVGAACLRGAGDTVTGFLVKLVVVLVNLVVSFALVTGWGFFPQMGWPGLAIGTAAGHMLGGSIIAWVLFRGRAGLRLQSAELRADRPTMARILKIGVPGGTDILTLVGSQLVFLSLINRLGVSAAAAHGLAIQIEACAYLPGGAFQIAAATMAGQLLGAGEPRRASQAVLTCLAWGGGVIVSAGFLIYFRGEVLAEFFSGGSSDLTTQTAGQLLQIVAVAMPMLAMVMILGGALRGAGDTRIPLLATILGLFVVRLPLALWLCFPGPLLIWGEFAITGWGWGVVGAWYAMAADLTTRAVVMATRFWQGGWRRMR